MNCSPSSNKIFQKHAGGADHWGDDATTKRVLKFFRNLTKAGPTFKSCPLKSGKDMYDKFFQNDSPALRTAMGAICLAPSG